MGTRGVWGFVLDGEEKLTYNHFDSYPSGLGRAVLHWLRGSDMEVALTEPEPFAALKDDVRRLCLVEDSEESYSALRDRQGNVDATLVGGRMIDSREFVKDSLFCEWGYVIDLDAETFEVYRGFQREPHSEGRFADRSVGEETSAGDIYYPIRLIKSWPLSELPTDQKLEALESDGEPEPEPEVDEQAAAHKRDYDYHYACREAVAALNTVLDRKRPVPPKLVEHIESLKAELEEQAAHIVAVWD